MTKYKIRIQCSDPFVGVKMTVNLISDANKKYFYDKERGVLIHRLSGPKYKAGDVAGTAKKSGHRYIRIKGRPITQMRVIWLLETGELPDVPVRVKDGDPNNTRFSNLMLSKEYAKTVTIGEFRSKTLPSRERLEQLFEYSEAEGGLWNKIRRGKAVVGTRSGVLSKRGYIQVSVDGVKYTEHRLVWWMLTGQDAYALDHIDRNKTNNRADNLRPASQSQNLANTADRSSKLGIPGVRILKGRDSNKRPYQAYLSHQGKQDHLGYFATSDEAFEAHKKAHLARYGEFSKYHNDKVIGKVA